MMRIHLRLTARYMRSRLNNRRVRRTGADMDEDFVVNETPGICGGYPRIGSTRIAVRSLVEVYLDTNENLDETI
ncbi:MAG: DUF433 domain-containing protein, partial [Thermomicrobiales bacterium]